MITPGKHENLNRAVIVVGADIIKIIKKTSFNIEDLYRILYEMKSIDIRTFYDTILFLWLANVVEVNEHRISLLVGDEE